MINLIYNNKEKEGKIKLNIPYGTVIFCYIMMVPMHYAFLFEPQSMGKDIFKRVAKILCLGDEL